MNKRLLGPISVCLTAASLSLARGEPPAKVVPEALPPAPAAESVAPAGAQDAPSAQKKSSAQDKSSAEPKPAAEPGKPQPPRLMPIAKEIAADSMAVQGTTSACGTATAPRRPPVDLKDCHIGPVERFWVKGEYLHWWTKNGPLPVPLLANGATGDVLLGNSDLDYGSRSGIRLTAGMWLDDLHQLGVEASGFWLERPTLSRGFNSDASGNPALVRPILGSEIFGTSFPTSVTIALPNTLSGGMSISSASRFWGAEANFVRNLFDNLNLSGSLIFGVRYLSLEENLQITQTSSALPGADLTGLNPLTGFVNPGTAADRFTTQNYFYGGQIGGRLGWRKGIWTVDVESKVALGPNHEAVNILGSTTLAGAAHSVSGGFLALQGTNIGHQSTNWFVVAPEVGVELGCQLSCHVRAQLGYNFLYMNSVVRPGEQVNINVNRSFLPPTTLPPFGPAEPHALFRQSDFWAHGITAGVTFTY